jgi:hypothetical protein
MKKGIRFSKAQSFILITILAVQSIAPVNPDLEQLQNYFKSLERGIECMVKRKPCAPEDRDAVWTAGKILALLGIGIAGGFAYQKQANITKFFARKKNEERTKGTVKHETKIQQIHPDREVRNHKPNEKELEDWYQSNNSNTFLHTRMISMAISDNDFVHVQNLVAKRIVLSTQDLDRLKRELTYSNFDENMRTDILKQLNSSHLYFPDILKEYYTAKDRELVDAIGDAAMSINSDLAMVTFALKEGANANTRSSFGHVLGLVLNLDNIKIAKELMKYGADPDMLISSSARKTMREAFPEKVREIEEELKQSAKVQGRKYSIRR